MTKVKDECHTLGGEVAKTDIGSYTATVTLADTDAYEWEDGTTAPLDLLWSISPDYSAFSAFFGTWRVETVIPGVYSELRINANQFEIYFSHVSLVSPSFRVDELVWTSHPVPSAGIAEDFTSGVKITGKIKIANQDFFTGLIVNDPITYYFYLSDDEQSLNVGAPTYPDGYWDGEYYEKITE